MKNGERRTGFHTKQDELDWALDQVRVLENDVKTFKNSPLICRFEDALQKTKELVKQIENKIAQS
jgi:hypothetical protein